MRSSGSATGMYAASPSPALPIWTRSRSPSRAPPAGTTDPHWPVSAILLAALSNTLVKYALVLVAGNRALKKAVLPGFAALVVALIIGGAVLLRS
jgi:hypothetical protein